MLDFDEHRHHRRILAGAFAPDRLRGYLAGTNPSVERGVARWQPGSGFQVYPAIKRLTLDVATEIFMGERLGPEADRFNAALSACVRAPASLVRVPAPGLRWSRGLAARRYLEEFLRSRVPAKRAASGADLFSRLCRAEAEDGSRLTGDDVVNHMILLMVAVTVPADTLVAVVLAFTHQMREYWPDPQRFDPERFADHRREDKVHPYAWEPFGGGPHTCVGLHFAGQQVKAVLHQMLLRYRWSVPAGYQLPLDRFPLPVPKDGLPVQLDTND